MEANSFLRFHLDYYRSEGMENGYCVRLVTSEGRWESASDGYLIFTDDVTSRYENKNNGRYKYISRNSFAKILKVRAV